MLVSRPDRHRLYGDHRELCDSGRLRDREQSGDDRRQSLQLDTDVHDSVVAR
jgi:hypothetical protein